tara:strand:+ start:1906 stop:2241 length:336 start_codon:yes stop_codon:yes gene_type:complete
MRVNISYSVDLDNVPSEVEKLLSEAEQIIEYDVLGPIEEAKEGVSVARNYSESIEKIDEARTSLVKTVARLEDCANILLGFNDVMNDQRKERHQQLLLNFEENIVPDDEVA